MSLRFEARWSIDPGTEEVPFTARTRVAKRDLPDLLDQVGAVLLCLPEDLSWRIEDDELVATGPAERRPTAEEIQQNREHGHQIAAAMEAAQKRKDAA